MSIAYYTERCAGETQEQSDIDKIIARKNSEETVELIYRWMTKQPKGMVFTSRELGKVVNMTASNTGRIISSHSKGRIKACRPSANGANLYTLPAGLHPDDHRVWGAR